MRCFWGSKLEVFGGGRDLSMVRFNDLFLNCLGWQEWSWVFGKKTLNERN